MNNAKMYITANPMQKKDTEEVLKELGHLMLWEKNEKVLDIGSGPGDVTVNVLKKYIPTETTIVGSDVAQEMVQYGNSQFKNTMIKFKMLDIQGKNIWKEWEKEDFNKIFSFYCLHWVKDQSQAVRNMHTLLKHGGEILLIFLSHNPVFTLYRTLSNMIKWGNYMNDVDNFISPYHETENPADQFAQLLKEEGFCEIKVHNRNTSFVYPTKESIINSICAVNPFLNRIPSHLRPEYNQCISNIIDMMNLAEKRPDETYEVKYSLIVAKAKKE